MSHHSYIHPVTVSSAFSKISFLDYGSKLDCRHGWVRQHKHFNDKERVYPPAKAFYCRNIYIISSGDINLIVDHCLAPISGTEINLDYAINAYHKLLQSCSIGNTCSTSTVNDHAIILTGHAPRLWGHFIAELLPRRLLKNLGSSRWAHKGAPIPADRDWALHRGCGLHPRIGPVFQQTPRALVAKELLTEDSSTSIYVSSSTLDFVIKAIRSIPTPLSIYIRFFNKGIAFSRKAIIPQHINYGSRLGFHPYAYERLSGVIRSITSQSDTRNCDLKEYRHHSKLYISRLHDGSYRQQTTARPIINEKDIIETMRDSGFKVIRMEDFSFAEKIQLLSGVSVIAGGFGFGLHNFCLTPKNHLIGAINLPFNFTQHDIRDCMRQILIDVPAYNIDDLSQVVEKTAGLSTAADLSGDSGRPP